MAHSQLYRAPQTPGQGLMFLLLLMQNRWEWLFGNFSGCYWRSEHPAFSSFAVSQNSDMRLCVRGCFTGICLHEYMQYLSGVRARFSVKQPLWGQTLFVWKEGGVSLYSVNTSKENISLLAAFLISWWTKAIKAGVVSWRIYISDICSGPGSDWHVH